MLKIQKQNIFIIFVHVFNFLFYLTTTPPINHYLTFFFALHKLDPLPFKIVYSNRYTDICQLLYKF